MRAAARVKAKMSGKRVVIFSYADSVHTSRWAPGMISRGYDVKVVSLGGTPIEDVETTVIPRSGKAAYLLKAPRAVREAQAFKPDLIHVHSATGYGLWALAAAFNPTLISVWGTDVIGFPSNWIKRRLTRTILKQACHITATSEYLAEAAGRILPAARNHISVIPFGVVVPEEVEPVRDEGPLRLCFLKVHLPIYGLDVLMRAMADVVQRFPDVHLTIAGEGPETVAVREMAKSLHLDDKVSFVGWLDNSRIYSFIRKHDLMVMPSRSESFGVAILEAAACGRATLASGVGGVPEVIVEGRTGMMVPPGDSQALADRIVHLAENRDELKRMGLLAHQFVRDKFAWDKSLDMMASLYDRVIHEAN